MYLFLTLCGPVVLFHWCPWICAYKLSRAVRIKQSFAATTPQRVRISDPSSPGAPWIACRPVTQGGQERGGEARGEDRMRGGERAGGEGDVGRRVVLLPPCLLPPPPPYLKAQPPRQRLRRARPPLQVLQSPRRRAQPYGQSVYFL